MFEHNGKDVTTVPCRAESYSSDKRPENEWYCSSEDLLTSYIPKDYILLLKKKRKKS